MTRIYYVVAGPCALQPADMDAFLQNDRLRRSVYDAWVRYFEWRGGRYKAPLERDERQVREAARFAMKTQGVVMHALALTPSGTLNNTGLE